MKKYGVVLLALLMSIPTISFAQQRESLKKKITRLEAENVVYQQQVALLQQQLDRAQHRADSLINVAGERAGQIIVLSSENENLRQNIQQILEEQRVQTEASKKSKQQQKVQDSAPRKAQSQAKPTGIPTFLREDIKKKCAFYSQGCLTWAEQIKKKDSSFQVIDYSDNYVAAPTINEEGEYIGKSYSTTFTYIVDKQVQEKEFHTCIK